MKPVVFLFLFFSPSFINASTVVPVVCQQHLVFDKILTERTEIRKTRKDEFATLKAFLSLSALSGFSVTQLSEEELNDWVNSHHLGFIVEENLYRIHLPVFLRGTQQLIGTLKLEYFPAENELAIGYAIAPQYRNQGFATEISQAGMEYIIQRFHPWRVHAIVHEKNASSIRVLEKLGFSPYDPVEGDKWRGYFYYTKEL